MGETNKIDIKATVISKKSVDFKEVTHKAVAGVDAEEMIKKFTISNVNIEDEDTDGQEQKDKA